LAIRKKSAECKAPLIANSERGKIFDVSGKLIKEIAFSSSRKPKISLKGIKNRK